MQKILDNDYFDLCLSGLGDLDSLSRLFEQAKGAGFDSMLWSTMIGGKAHFHSKVASRLGTPPLHPGSWRIPELLARFDPLEKAIELAHQHDMKLIFYFRLLDGFYIGLEEDFFKNRPDLWWQSRCGEIPFRGWPCYHQPEVREYKMRLFRELAAYQPDGFMIDVGRSHAPYANPQRCSQFFGFDTPVAEEYLQRYGVDIRGFDYIEPLQNEEGMYGAVPFVHGAEYVNAAEFDHDAWNWLKGESIDSFIREMRAAAPEATLMLQSGLCPPHSLALADTSPAQFYLDANQLAADGIIDGYSFSRNFIRQTPAQIEAFFFPHFQGVREAGKAVGVWLNDALIADGGTGRFIDVGGLRDYIERVNHTSLDYVVIHEADFILRHQQPNKIWALLKELEPSRSVSC